jgi:outer membrane protein assembly factor BamB
MGHGEPGRGARYYIVVRRVRTTTSCAIEVLTTVLLTIASGFCPGFELAAQTNTSERAAQTNNTERYEAIVRLFRDTKRPPTPLLGAEAAWTLMLPLAPAAAAAMDDDRIYVPLREKQLVALDRETGRHAWSRLLDVAVPPVAGDGRLFVQNGRMITALDSATGADRWSASLEAAPAAPLAWIAGAVIALLESGDVLAFRSTDGQLMWRRSLGSTSPYPGVPGDTNALFFSLADGRVVALAGETGDQLWERKLPGTLSQPAVGRDRVFIGSTDNIFYALDARRGDEAWKWRNGGDVIGAAVDGDVVYFASLDNIIRAVNRGNGNQRWRKATGTRPVFPPRAFRGIVVLPGLMPSITVFVGESGEVMGTQAAAGDLVGPPLVDQAPKPFQVAVVTVTREGVIEALRPTSLMFREEKTAPIAALPGRALARE